MKAETYDTLIKNSADKLKKEKSFIRRNYVIFWIALAIYAFATILSASAIFANLRLWADETFFPAIGVILAVIGTLAVIGMQFMLKSFVDDIQAGAHNKGGSDGAMMALKGIIGACGIAAGVWLSLGGAGAVVEYVAKKETAINVDLISVDSIKNEFNMKVAEYQRTQNAYLGTKYRGTTTAPALKQSAKYTDIIDRLEQERAASIAAAEAKNQAAMDEYYAKTTNNKARARGWMGIAEALIALSIILIGIFDDGVKREAKVHLQKAEEKTFR